MRKTLPVCDICFKAIYKDEDVHIGNFNGSITCTVCLGLSKNIDTEEFKQERYEE